MKNKRKLCILIITAVILLIAAIPLLKKIGSLLLNIITDILNDTNGSYIKALIVILTIYIIKTIVMVIPLNALYIGAGMVFPPLYAVIISYIGVTVEMTLGFFIGRRIKKTNTFKKLEKNKYANKVMEFGNSNSVFSSMLVRIIKGPPADLTSIFMGSTGMNYTQYILGTLLGITPGMIPVIFMGKAVFNPFSAEFFVPLALYSLFMITTFVIFRNK